MSGRPICTRLRAPAYWMSGSSDYHEGENNAPREAADIIEALCEGLDSAATFISHNVPYRTINDPKAYAHQLLRSLDALLAKARGEQ